MRSAVSRTVRLAAALLLAFPSTPASAQVSGPQVESAAVTASSDGVSVAGTVALRAHPRWDEEVSVDASGDVPVPGADLLRSTVRTLTPDVVEFSLRTSRATVTAPDGTAVTPGGAALVYVWDVTTSAAAPMNRFQVQARRCCGASTIDEPYQPLFLLLTRFDGVRYTKVLTVPGTFTRDAVSWQEDGTRELLFGDASWPERMTVAASVRAAPGGTGSLPGESQLTPGVTLDSVEPVEYRHPRPRMVADLRPASSGESTVSAASLTRGRAPGDADQGRYAYSVALPGRAPGPGYSLSLVVTFGSAMRVTRVCGFGQHVGDDPEGRQPCPVPQ